MRLLNVGYWVTKLPEQVAFYSSAKIGKVFNSTTNIAAGYDLLQGLMRDRDSKEKRRRILRFAPFLSRRETLFNDRRDAVGDYRLRWNVPDGYHQNPHRTDDAARRH